MDKNDEEQFLKMAKKTLIGPGLEPETSGLIYQSPDLLNCPTGSLCFQN